MEWRHILIIITLTTLANGGFLWAVKWMLTNDRKRIMKDLSEARSRTDEQNKKHEKLREEIIRFKEQMPKEYVRREDWIICFARMEQKVDAIWAFIHKFCQDRK